MLSFILEHHKMQFCPSELFQIDLSNGANWKDVAHNSIYCTALFSLRYKISTNKMLVFNFPAEYLCFGAAFHWFKLLQI